MKLPSFAASAVVGHAIPDLWSPTRRLSQRDSSIIYDIFVVIRDHSVKRNSPLPRLERLRVGDQRSGMAWLTIAIAAKLGSFTHYCHAGKRDLLLT